MRPEVELITLSQNISLPPPSPTLVKIEWIKQSEYNLSKISRNTKYSQIVELITLSQNISLPSPRPTLVGRVDNTKKIEDILGDI